MTGPSDFDRTLADWLDDTGAQDIPPHVIDAAIDRSRHTRRARPLPDFLTRWLPMSTNFAAAPPLVRPRPLARLGPVWAVIALALLALALIGAALLSVGTSPAPPAAVRNGLIAFDSAGDILVADPDGTNVRPIVTGPAMQVAASWSPDGRRLAYLERTQGDGDYAEATDEFLVLTVDQDGHDVIDITAGEPVVPIAALGANGLTWSSDGTQLAFAIQDRAAVPARSRIVVARADGSGRQVLDLPVDAQDPIWQPGSDLLAFRVPVDTLDGGVWVVGADGADPRRLTTRTALGDGYAFVGPSWSAGGDRIVYGCCAGPHDIWTVDLAGTEEQVTTAAADEYWPTWSPVDDRILFQRDISAATAPENDESVIGLDGQETRVDVEPAAGWGPMVWSPTGEEFLAMSSYTSELLVISLDGTHESYRIPAPGNSVFGTGWSWQRQP